MKIQLDYDNKTISLESDVLLNEFVKKIKAILPDWKQWTVRHMATIYTTYNPITIIDYTRPWYIGQPYTVTNRTGFSASSNDGPTNGIYNLELN